MMRWGCRCKSQDKGSSYHLCSKLEEKRHNNAVTSKGLLQQQQRPEERCGDREDCRLSGAERCPRGAPQGFDEAAGKKGGFRLDGKNRKKGVRDEEEVY